MQFKKLQQLVDQCALMFGPNCPYGFTDAQVNRAAGAWKRAQELTGIPKPPETRQRISDALKGRRLSAETRAKISASPKARRAG